MYQVSNNQSGIKEIDDIQFCVWYVPFIDWVLSWFGFMAGFKQQYAKSWN